MTITSDDVGRNPFNLFAVERNGALDTPEGVRVKLRTHDRNQLAGQRQESLRRQWGLKIDPAVADAVIITGHTVASLAALRRQYDEGRAQAARAKRQATLDRLAALHQAVNTLEQTLEVALTTRKDLKHQFEDPFDWEPAAERATEWLSTREAWLTVAHSFLPQIGQLRSIFSGQTLEVSKDGLKGNGWVASYDSDVMESLIKSPGLAESVENRVDELFVGFEKKLKRHGFVLEELDHFPDYGSVVISSADDQVARNDQLFRETFVVDPCDIRFSLAFQGDDTVKRLCWKDVWHPWSSVDAVLLLQKLTNE